MILGGGALWRIDSLQRDAREASMSEKIEKLESIKEKFETYQSDVEDMVTRIEELNQKINRNAVRKRETVNVIIPDTTDTAALEEGANKMNDVFDRMSNLGRK